MTIPRTVVPVNGFPTLVYAHGTSGDFRNFIRQGLAAAFAQGGTGDKAAPSVMIADGVLHGPRKAIPRCPWTAWFLIFLTQMRPRQCLAIRL